MYFYPGACPCRLSISKSGSSLHHRLCDLCFATKPETQQRRLRPTAGMVKVMPRGLCVPSPRSSDGLRGFQAPLQKPQGDWFFTPSFCHQANQRNKSVFVVCLMPVTLQRGLCSLPLGLLKVSASLPPSPGR